MLRGTKFNIDPFSTDISGLFNNWIDTMDYVIGQQFAIIQPSSDTHDESHVGIDFSKTYVSR